MKVSFRSLIFIFSFAVMTLTGTVAFSAKVLDSSLHNVLSSASQQSLLKIPVVVVFKDTKTQTFQGDERKLSRAQIERQMQKQNQQSLRKLQIETATLALPRIEKNLWLINGFVAALNPLQIQALLQNPDIATVSLADRKIKIANPPSDFTQIHSAEKFTYGLKKIGLQSLLEKRPDLTGEGVRVGILDTGIDATHPDLKGKLKAYRDFSPANNPQPQDDFGHGTHVAGTIAGGNKSGQSIGVVPKAELIVGRIFDGNGESTTAGILEAMQWITDPDGKPETDDFPRVVNSSWGDDEPYTNRDPNDDPFCKVVDAWVKLQMVPVFSAGNSGPKEGSIGLPGGCPNSLTVGATEEWDRSPYFSSTGPAKWKNSQISKPDVVAPGVNIYSAEPRGGYQDMSGTSMATPHVSGAVALMLQVSPHISVSEIRSNLISGVKDLGTAGHDNVFGWGRIDIFKSIENLKQ